MSTEINFDQICNEAKISLFSVLKHARVDAVLTADSPTEWTLSEILDIYAGLSPKEHSETPAEWNPDQVDAAEDAHAELMATYMMVLEAGGMDVLIQFSITLGYDKKLVQKKRVSFQPRCISPRSLLTCVFNAVFATPCF